MIIDHAIRRIELNLKFTGNHQVSYFENKFRSIVNNHFPGIIDEILNRIDFPKENIIIPNIELELGRINSYNIEEEFVRRFIAEFEKQLEALISQPEKNIRFVNKELSKQEALMMFLTTGSFPWWAGIHQKTSFDEIFNQVITTSQQFSTIISELKDKTQIQRLVNQLKAQSLRKFLFGFSFPGSDIAWRELSGVFNVLTQSLSANRNELIQKIIFTQLLSDFAFKKQFSFTTNELLNQFIHEFSDMSFSSEEKSKLLKSLEGKSAINLTSEIQEMLKTAVSGISLIDENMIPDSVSPLSISKTEDEFLNVEYFNELKTESEFQKLLENLQKSSGFELENEELRNLLLMQYFFKYASFPQSYSFSTQTDFFDNFSKIITKYPEAQKYFQKQFQALVQKKDYEELMFIHSEKIISAIMPEISKFSHLVFGIIGDSSIFKTQFGGDEIEISQLLIKLAYNEESIKDEILQLFLTKSIWVDDIQKIKDDFLSDFSNEPLWIKQKFENLFLEKFLKVIINQDYNLNLSKNEFSKIEFELAKIKASFIASKYKSLEIAEESIFKKIIESKLSEDEHNIILQGEKKLLEKHLKDKKTEVNLQKESIIRSLESELKQLKDETKKSITEIKSQKDDDFKKPEVKEEQKFPEVNIFKLMPAKFFEDLLAYLLTFNKFPWWSERLISEILKREKEPITDYSFENLLNVYLKGLLGNHPEIIKRTTSGFLSDDDFLKKIVFTYSSKITENLTRPVLSVRIAKLQFLFKALSNRLSQDNSFDLTSDFLNQSLLYFILKNLQTFESATFQESFLAMLDYTSILTRIPIDRLLTMLPQSIKEITLDKEFEKEVVEILESLKSDEYIESEQAKSFMVVKEKLITDSSFIHQLEMQFFTILRQIIEKQHFPESIEMISNAAFEKMFSKVLQEQSFFAQQFLPDYLKNSYSRIAFLEFFSPRFLQDALSNFTAKSHFEKIGNLPEEILNIAKAILNLIKDKPIIDLEYISKSINFSLFELILSRKIETITKSELVQVLLKSSLDAIKTKSTKILLLPEKEDFDKMLKDFPDISFQLINELSIKKSVSEDILSSLSDRTDIVNIKDVFTSSTEFLTALSVYFLKYGNIPWWCPEEIKPEDALHQLLKLINSGKIQKLTDFEKIFKTRTVVQRMTEFLDYESIFSLLSVSGLYESKSMVLKVSKLLQKYFATKTALTSPNEIQLVILNYLISLSGTFKSDNEKEILARVIEYFSEIEALESSKIIDGIVDFQHKEGSESKIEAELKNDLILLRNDFDEAKDFQSKLDFLKSYKKINSLKQVKEFSDILKFLLEFESISEIELQTIISIFKKHLQELQNDEKNQLAKVLVDAITDSKIAEEIKTFYQEITEKSKILKQFEVLKSIDSLDSKSDIAGFTKEFQKFIQYINLTKLEKFDVFSLIKEHFLSLLDKGYIEIANVWLDALKRFDSESQNKLIQEWIKKFSSRRSIDKKIENKLIGHISDSIKAVGKDSLILFKISEPIKSLTISFESFFADFHKEILPKGKFSPSNIKKLLEIKLWSLFTDDKISKKIDKQIIFEILDFIFSKSFETKDYQIIIRFSDFNNVIISLLKRHFPSSLSGSDFQEISNLLVGHFSDSLKMFEKSEPIKSLFISFESFFEDFYKKLIPESKFQQSNIKRLLETKLSSLFIKQKIEHEIKDETKHEIYESFFKKIDKQIILEILEFIFSKSFETKHYQIVIRHSDFDNIIILLLKSNFSSSLSANDFKQISNSLFKYFEDNITQTGDVSKRTDKIPDNELSEILGKDIHDDLENKSMISKVSEPLTETEKNKYPSVKEVIEDDDIKNLIEKMTDDEIYHKIIKQRYDWLDKQDKDGKYYVQNAGLVIFYPFLKTFFNRMKLLNEKFEFIGFSEKEKAVHLLQYIATGEDIHPEYLLVLNKIFCGLDISFPVRLDVELTVEDKNECDLLFKSVIAHWEIVKNSTIPSVRETFIQRDGVLVKQNGNWNLKVEQKGFDVLVQKIPWGFSTMKFSWTKYIIFVEWT